MSTPLSLNDYMYAYYSALVTGNAAMAGAINVSRAAVGVEATTAFTGGGAGVDAPAADAVIGSVSLGSGTYEIEITTFVLGTTVAKLDSCNMRMKIGAANHGTIITPVPGTSGGAGLGTYSTRINITSTTTISVNAIAAATAGSTYIANIVAKKIGF